MSDIRALILVVAVFSIVACGPSGAPREEAVAASDPAPAAEPRTASELIERSRAELDRGPHSFRLVESRGERVLRTGRLTAYPSSSRPVVDLLWEEGGEAARLRSDGTAVFAKERSGDVATSSWSEAGSVLYGKVAGRLVGAAVDPSSFAAYGAELAPDPSPGTMRLEVALPTGGGWSWEVSTESWLPRSVTFQPDAESEVERLVLEPAPEIEPPSADGLELAPDADGALRPFYAGPAPDQPAPDVKFELADGGAVTLGELRGSVVVVDFWATWCAPCRPAMKELEALYQAHRDDGLAVYGLRLFDQGDPTEYLSSLGISYPIGDGTPFVEPYAVGVYGLPTLYVIDREGSIAKLMVGFTEGSGEVLAEAVASALGS